MPILIPLNTIIHNKKIYPPDVPASFDDDVAEDFLARGKARLPVAEAASFSPPEPVSMAPVKRGGKIGGKLPAEEV